MNNYDQWKLASPPETECKCKECGKEISIMDNSYCDECFIELTNTEIE
jgi:hypothetical protein